MPYHFVMPNHFIMPYHLIMPHQLFIKSEQQTKCWDGFPIKRQQVEIRL